MPSEYFDESVAQRYERFAFDFSQRTLAGRTVILAGGSGGLGAATAMLLAAEGARLVIGYRADTERAEALKAAALAAGAAEVRLVAGDLADEPTRQALLDAAGHTLESLVVFAGDPARGVDEKTLRASLEANYVAPILLARTAADRMKASATAGSIVLFSSMQGDYPFEGSTAYGAAKAALAQAALVLAKEVGGKPNIRVNVIAPGATMAGMAQTSLRSGKYDPFVASGVVPRFGRAEDIARTVRFLIEPDNYVTGQVLTVDGGMTLRRDQR
jgi:NAD(P)-dependent dehydrogenase (short-subunit alcohol dehydrogenase family)